MARSKSRRVFRYKLIGIALVAAIVSIGILKLSQMVASSVKQPTATTASAPATEGQRPTESPEAATARNLSGLLLIFGLASLGLVIICIGWLVLDIRRSRPAWKTQKKYPKKR